jgi:hypothetical protein
MITLADLIGEGAVASADTINRWEQVPAWSLAGNDRYGDCTFVSLCNLKDMRAALLGKPFVIEEAEAELFYSREAQFNSQNPATDKGAVLADVIQYWADNGWPSDPTETIDRWCAIAPEQIHLTVDKLYGSPAWCQLPILPNGDIEWTDAALAIDPSDGHAFLIAGSDPLGYTIIPYAAPVHVSLAWWARFGRGQFAIKLA